MSVPKVGVTDALILEVAGQCEAIGIDAPFGWPVPFVEFIDRNLAPSGSLPFWTGSYRDQLRFRQTDFKAKEILGRWPLSVSSDLIAITAMRCAGLLADLNVVDRSGVGRVFEVYPAVALCAWGLPSRGYRQNLGFMIDQLLLQCSWLKLSDEVTQACLHSHHAFDSLVSSMVARAASLGLTAPPNDVEAELAKTEGWIAIPHRDSLGKLFVQSIM